MDTFEHFKATLHETLTHLYDPVYHPPATLWQVIGQPGAPNLELTRAALLQTIEQLKPAPGTPTTARSTRIYQLLAYRYVQELTQKETAIRLGITPRHLRREQQDAIQWLAERLWQQRPSPPAEHGLPRDPIQADSDWRAQVHRELGVLQQNAPGAIAPLAEAFRSIHDLASALTAGRHVAIHLAAVEPSLAVRIHPALLRQLLISAMENLLPLLAHGQLHLRARRHDNTVAIQVLGTPISAQQAAHREFIDEIMSDVGGRCHVYHEAASLCVALELPVAGTVNVLVIDDNADLVHFYRRYSEGTRFQITHLAEGGLAHEAINRSPPDLIVLDVMLPDVDGWKLLGDLRVYQIPILVCSVVRRQELALALGAVAYLAKPVHRQEFIGALEGALR